MSANGGDLYGRDTIARCDTYSNPYDLRPDADLARRRLSERNIGAGPDELESDGTRLERQLVEKFQKGQFSILRGEKMGNVMTGGKFILLAFVMPAYLFFYGLPRWLLQNTFPPIAAMVAQAAEQVQGIARFAVQFTQNIFAVVTNKAENLIAWNKGSEESKQGFVQWAYNGVKTGAENGVKSVKESVKNVYENFVKAMAGVYHFFADPVINSVQRKIDAVVNFYNGVKGAFEKVNQAIRNKVQETVDGVKERYYSVVEGIKSVFRPAVHFAVNAYQAVADGIVNRYNGIKETANDVREWVVSKAKEISHEISKRVKEKANEVVHGIKNVAEAIAAPFVNGAVWVQDQAVNLFAIGRAWAAKTTETTKNSLVWMITKGLPKLIEKVMPKWLNPMFLWKEGKNLAKKFKDLGSFMRKKIGDKVMRVRRRIAETYSRFMSMLKWVWGQVKAALIRFYKKRLKLILSYLTPSAIGNGIKNVISVFRAVFKIARRMSQELLSDLTS